MYYDYTYKARCSDVYVLEDNIYYLLFQKLTLTRKLIFYSLALTYEVFALRCSTDNGSFSN